MIVGFVKNILTILPSNKKEQVEEKLRKFYHFLQKQPSASFFLIHEVLLSIIFKKPKNYSVFSPIPKQLNDKLIKMSFENQTSLKKEKLSYNPLLLMEKHSSTTIDKLDQNIIGIKGDMSVYNDVHQWLFPQIREYVNSPIAFVNTRSWISKPGSSRYGPNDNHTDGFYDGHIKVMLYSTPLNKDYGELELKGEIITGLEQGSSVAFRNSDVEHSGLPGETQNRISTEITCMRCFVNIAQEHAGALLGRHYKSILTPYFLYIKKNGLSKFLGLILGTLLFLKSNKIRYNILGKNNIFKCIYSYSLALINKCLKIEKINIGSGRNVFLKWASIDELDYPGIDKIKLDEKVIFPYDSKSVSIAYTSHNIEHLNDKTVDRVIQESGRVIKKNGFLVIKIPDFEYFIQKYRENDTNFFINTGAEGVSWSWKNKNVNDTIENRVAMMICGYWNKDYGDHFSGNVNFNNKAYHGPPLIKHEKLKHILENCSVREICKKLREIPLKEKDFKAFNHQNAWSANDLIKVVEKHGFDFVNLSKKQILSKFLKDIPTLKDYMDWSMYVVFKKKY